MIRSLVALFVFAVMLYGYIVLRPSDAPQRAVVADEMPVTRTQTDTILPPPDQPGRADQCRRNSGPETQHSTRPFRPNRRQRDGPDRVQCAGRFGVER